jgi:peroxiredoxin
MKKCLFILSMLIPAVMLFAQEKPEGLFINSKAPDFKATDQDGNAMRLKDLVKKGNVVLIFYRGNWCPYCNRQLSQLQDSLQFIIDKGAQVIAVTPEQPEGILKTIEKTKASFPIIFDEDRKIMKAYDVSFAVDEKSISRYKMAGIDLEENNGKNGANLPVPAVYIINKESTIIYRFFEPNYKKRASVKEIIKNL